MCWNVIRKCEAMHFVKHGRVRQFGTRRAERLVLDPGVPCARQELMVYIRKYGFLECGESYFFC